MGELINGKRYPLWEQFVDKKGGFIGEILQDEGFETEIVDVTLSPNGDDSAYFEVHGKEFSCGFDVKYGGLSSDNEGMLKFSTDYNSFSIKKPEKENG